MGERPCQTTCPPEDGATVSHYADLDEKIRPKGPSATAKDATVAEYSHRRRHHVLERGRAEEALKPADPQLGARILAAFRQPLDRYLEYGVKTERIAVGCRGVARRDQQDAIADPLAAPRPVRAGPTGWWPEVRRP